MTKLEYKAIGLLVVCVVYFKSTKLQLSELFAERKAALRASASIFAVHCGSLWSLRGSLRGYTCKRCKLRLLDEWGVYGKIDFNSRRQQYEFIYCKKYAL